MVYSFIIIMIGYIRICFALQKGVIWRDIDLVKMFYWPYERSVVNDINFHRVSDINCALKCV